MKLLLSAVSELVGVWLLKFCTSRVFFITAWCMCVGFAG